MKTVTPKIYKLKRLIKAPKKKNPYPVLNARVHLTWLVNNPHLENGTLIIAQWLKYWELHLVKKVKTEIMRFILGKESESLHTYRPRTINTLFLIRYLSHGTIMEWISQHATKATVITSQSMKKNHKIETILNIKQEIITSGTGIEKLKMKRTERLNENSDHRLSNSSRDKYKSPTSQTTHDLYQ